jgi:hypothetical protein
MALLQLYNIACAAAIAGFSDRWSNLGERSPDAMAIPEMHRAVMEREGSMTPWRKAAFGMEMTAEELALVAPDWERAERWIQERTGGHSN